MSDLVKRAQYEIVHNESFAATAGKSLAVTGGTGLGLWFLAGLIPFVSLPMLLVLMVIGGGALWVKSL